MYDLTAVFVVLILITVALIVFPLSLAIHIILVVTGGVVVIIIIGSLMVWIKEKRISISQIKLNIKYKKYLLESLENDEIVLFRRYIDRNLNKETLNMWLSNCISITESTKIEDRYETLCKLDLYINFKNESRERTITITVASKDVYNNLSREIKEKYTLIANDSSPTIDKNKAI